MISRAIFIALLYCVTATEPTLHVVVSSHTPWIKEYLAFDDSVRPPPNHHLVPRTKPLRTKITSYGPALSNDEDIAAWTRKVVQQLKEDHAQQSSYHSPPLPVDVDLDRLAEYLVTMRGFTRDQVAFLSDPSFNGTADDVDRTLSAIKKSPVLPRTISIAGGFSTWSVAPRLSVPLYAAMAAALL